MVSLRHNMRGGVLPLFFLTFVIMPCVTLMGAPRPPGVGGDVSPAIQDLRDTVGNLRYQVNNHEQEIREFDEKLKNLDIIIESVRDQLSDATKSHKEQLKGNSASLESKITALETTSKGLVADLRQFKKHANDSAAALAQYKQKIGDLEKVIEQQNQNIEHLQAAMRSLMEALQGKDASPAKAIAEGSEVLAPNSYRIKPGDSLEKIARNHGTTVQVLKELNGLTNDKIVVGKVLTLPEKKSE